MRKLMMQEVAELASMNPPDSTVERLAVALLAADGMLREAIDNHECQDSCRLIRDCADDGGLSTCRCVSMCDALLSEADG